MLFTSECAVTTVDSLAHRGFAFVDPDPMLSQGSGWSQLATTWDDLRLDTYMADGGTYRYRRYGRLTLNSTTGELTPLPDSPYRQETDHNPLNGGIDRHFAPLTDGFVRSTVLAQVLREMGGWYCQLTGCDSWEIMLHQNRIIARTGQPGQPAPEGPHRDGVTYIGTMLVNRLNVDGGESRVHDGDGRVVHAQTLSTPGDLLVGDDVRTLHSVTPVVPVDPEREGHRDVLVIGFTAASV
ncbi:MAG: hypothetical protein QOG94_3201 [Solirubrobacteraceae bacterium]|jgi:hypothetical protein|nr:hypothetical protein [Solirubrobacteraceae bacterium]